MPRDASPPLAMNERDQVPRVEKPRGRLAMRRTLSAPESAREAAPRFSIGHAVLLLAGPLSLLVAPLPARPIIGYLVVGAIAGIFWAPRQILPGFVGLAVFLFGVDYPTADALRQTPQLVIPVWQPYLVAASTWMAVPLAWSLLRRSQAFSGAR